MQTIYRHIAEIVPQLQGWCSVEKAQALAAAIITLRPKTTVEIGVFGGRSLIPMAMTHEFISQGIVIGIDPWDPDESARGQNGANARWWSKLDHKAIYDGFVKQLDALHLHHVVAIHRRKSDDATPPDVIDLLHIDGNHSDQAVRDVERFASHVRIGGLCFADDIAWEGGGVQRAVQKLHEIGFVQLYPLETGAMFQRVK